MLWNLLNEKSVWDVSTRFDVPRGFIQNLFASAASFASSVQRFCEVSIEHLFQMLHIWSLSEAWVALH